MSYSYTEKRRIRKNFGRLPKVMELPRLIETQLDSYSQFLQRNVEVDKRENQGLEEVFRTLFPITSVSGNAALEYVSYEFGKSTYTVQECLIQGLSYSAPLHITVRLVIYDRDTNFEEVKDVKEGFNAKIKFSETLIHHEIKTDYLDNEIQNMIDTINSDKIPDADKSCKNCAYARRRSSIDKM